MTGSTERKVATAFALGLLIMFCLGVVAALSGRELLHNAKLLDHSYAVLRAIEDLYIQTINLESSSQGYALSGSTPFLDSFERSRAAVERRIEELRNLTSDNSLQQGRLDELAPLLSGKIAFGQALIQARNGGAIEKAEELVASGTGWDLMIRVSALTSDIETEERRLLDVRTERAERAGGQAVVAVVCGWALASAGSMLLGFSIWRDLRARRAAEAALEKSHASLEMANAQLGASNQQLEAFSYSVSHDLRVPLRAIDGYSRMLMEDYGDRLDAEAKRLITVVRASTQDMGRLIDDLLAFSRAGRQPLHLDSLDVGPLVRDAWNQVTRGLEVVPRLAMEELPRARGDAATIRQVLTNLLANAVKFSRHTPDAMVEVSGSAGSGEVVYRVRDNGCGFDMRYADKLFNVFQRLHLKEEYEGTGVGLALVGNVIQRHGGRVWADGEPGKGATFYFTLPPVTED